MIKGELDRKIMTNFVGLRPKMYDYVKDDGNGDKTAKTTKHA